MKERIDWIDSLKGLAIIFVLIGHLNPEAEIERYIYSVHMFLFFSISGFLHNNETSLSWNYLFKKSKRLLMPYLFWSIIAAVYTAISENPIKALKALIALDGVISWDSPLWFLPVIFLTTVIYTSMRRLGVYRNILCIFSMPIVWKLMIGFSPVLKIDIVPVALFFYAVGNVIKTFFSSDFFKNNNKTISILLIPATAIVHTLFGVNLNVRIIFTYSVFGNALYCLLAGIGGVLFFFLVFNLTKSNRILVYFGKNSIFLMCSHYWYLWIMNKISLRFADYDLWHTRGTYKALIVTAVLLSAIYLTISVIKIICKKHPAMEKYFVTIGWTV